MSSRRFETEGSSAGRRLNVPGMVLYGMVRFTCISMSSLAGRTVTLFYLKT